MTRFYSYYIIMNYHKEKYFLISDVVEQLWISFQDLATEFATYDLSIQETDKVSETTLSYILAGIHDGSYDWMKAISSHSHDETDTYTYIWSAQDIHEQAFDIQRWSHKIGVSEQSLRQELYDHGIISDLYENKTIELNTIKNIIDTYDFNYSNDAVLSWIDAETYSHYTSDQETTYDIAWLAGIIWVPTSSLVWRLVYNRNIDKNHWNHEFSASHASWSTSESIAQKDVQKSSKDTKTYTKEKNNKTWYTKAAVASAAIAWAWKLVANASDAVSDIDLWSDSAIQDTKIHTTTQETYTHTSSEGEIWVTTGKNTKTTSTQDVYNNDTQEAKTHTTVKSDSCTVDTCDYMPDAQIESWVVAGDEYGIYNTVDEANLAGIYDTADTSAAVISSTKKWGFFKNIHSGVARWLLWLLGLGLLGGVSSKLWSTDTVVKDTVQEKTINHGSAEKALPIEKENTAIVEEKKAVKNMPTKNNDKDSKKIDMWTRQEKVIKSKPSQVQAPKEAAKKEITKPTNIQAAPATKPTTKVTNKVEPKKNIVPKNNKLDVMPAQVWVQMKWSAPEGKKAVVEEKKKPVHNSATTLPATLPNTWAK